MDIVEAQRDMRRAEAGGGPGVLVSGLVWLAAALVESSRGVHTGFAVLFIGGMLIYPVSTMLVRYLFRRKPVAPDNQIGRAVLESTITMLGGLLPAYLFLYFEPAYVFPLAAIAVGTHYFAFRTAYGDIRFWILGAAIAGLGLIGIFAPAVLPIGMIFLVALAEFVCAAILIRRDSQSG
jgi:hypothetical protein